MKDYYNKNQVRVLFLLIAFMFVSGIVFAQEDKKEQDSPVQSTFATGILIENQTIVSPTAKAFELRIDHRFGQIKDMSDIFGIYAASNIKLGLDYGVTDKIMIGFATEKYNKMQEFHAKYNILSQTVSGKIPVSVSYFVNTVIDARNKDVFGANYKFISRLSFFHQLIVARKFGEKLSVQVAGSFAHFNMVDTTWKNDYIGAYIGGRYNFYNNMSAIFEYNHPFAINKKWQYQLEPKPNLALGFEIETGTHVFQVFAGQYDQLIPQKNLANNLNDLTKNGWRLGFNITVRF